MRHAFIVGPIVLSLAFVGLHCSSDSTSTGAGDAGGATDSASGADTGSADSAAEAATSLNDCTAADLAAGDMTGAAAARTIAFPADALPVQYSPHCMTIKVGQSVTWNGSFAAHPLEAMGGDAGNPIMPTSTGMTTSVTFPAAGTFGFDCANHPSIMRGVILVVP